MDKKFNFKSLTDESILWGSFLNTKNIIELLIADIQNTIFLLVDNHLKITLNIKFSMGEQQNFLNLYLICVPREIDLFQTVKTLVESVKNIKLELQASQVNISKVNNNQEKISEFNKIAINKSLEEVFSKLDLHKNELSNLGNSVKNKISSLEKTDERQTNNIKDIWNFINNNMLKRFPIEVPIKNCFHNSNYGKFKSSNSDKTINKSGNGWEGIYCKDKLVFDGNVYEFSIKVDFTAHYEIMLGFAVSGLEKKEGLHTKPQSWMFLFKDGKYFNCNNDMFYFANEYIRPMNGDIISICIDTTQNLLYAKINGRISGSNRKFTINEYQKQCLFPCVDMYHGNDEITII